MFQPLYPCFHSIFFFYFSRFLFIFFFLVFWVPIFLFSLHSSLPPLISLPLSHLSHFSPSLGPLPPPLSLAPLTYFSLSLPRTSLIFSLSFSLSPISLSLSRTSHFSLSLSPTSYFSLLSLFRTSLVSPSLLFPPLSLAPTSSLEDLGNGVYLFIAFVPRSTLARCGSTW